MSNQTIAIIGASGGLGSAFVDFYAQDPSNTVYAFSRSPIHQSLDAINYGTIDYADENSIIHAAEQSSNNGLLDCVIVATGMLHDFNLMPEKSLRDLNTENFQRSFFSNTIGPALIAKHFLPKLNGKQRSIFAALSARVGSISDNQLGGWYAYRSAKAALNMLIKTASIECARRHPEAIIVGLHPGTVDTGLSKPFQQRVPKDKLFTKEHSVKQLIKVIDGLSAQDSGSLFAWDGSRIPF